MASSKRLLLLFLACGLLCSAWPTSARLLDDVDVDDALQQFKEWTEKYGRKYKNEVERLQRLGIFTDNLKYVAEFIKAAAGDARRGYTIGLNQFADLTNEEFLAQHTGLRVSPNATATTAASPAAAPRSATTEGGGGGVPSSIDWRTRGAVTAVKNQGTCGSCWAFSAVAVIESAVVIKKGQPPADLSEQELVDCVSTSFGCKGGLMDDAFAFVAGNGGITTEARYPYVGLQGSCMVTALQEHAASISGFENVPENDEGALMEAVAQQPVTVGIDGGGRDFQLYTGGIFDGPCGPTKLNHAVTLVGYGEDEGGNKYWIAKNSWGTSWGDEGYILMKKDVPQKEGLCGLAMLASYATV